MNTLSNGGPAFPVVDPTISHRAGTAAIEGVTDTAERDRLYTEAASRAGAGMPLRDYFAARFEVDPEFSTTYAKTLLGRDVPDYHGDPIGNAIFWADFRARMRYIEADAMLRARGAA